MEERNNTEWHLPETLQELEDFGDGALVLDLIDCFKDDTAGRLKRLHDGVANLALAAVKSEAHAIRGGARQMGAEDLANLCQAIESSAQAMDWPEQERRVCQAELRFTEICSVMTAYSKAKRAG